MTGEGERHRIWVSGETAMLIGVVAVVIHEAMCEQDQLLSDAADRLRARHPVLVHTAVIATAAHLLRRIPRRLDVYSYAPVVTVHLLPRYRRTRERQPAIRTGPEERTRPTITPIRAPR